MFLKNLLLDELYQLLHPFNNVAPTFKEQRRLYQLKQQIRNQQNTPTQPNPQITSLPMDQQDNQFKQYLPSNNHDSFNKSIDYNYYYGNNYGNQNISNSNNVYSNNFTDIPQKLDLTTNKNTNSNFDTTNKLPQTTTTPSTPPSTTTPPTNIPLKHIPATITKPSPIPVAPDLYHQCKDCSRSFKYPKCLTKHQLWMHSSHPYHLYKCLECLKIFKCSSSFAKHKKVHSGEQPYACVLCKTRFSQSSNLNRHYRAVHQVNKVDVEGKNSKLFGK